MYCNICYKLENWEGRIWIREFDENGKRIEKFVPHTSYLYYEDKNGTSEYKSMFNNPVEKVTFNSVVQRKQWINQHPNMPLFEYLKPEREYLLNKYFGQNEDPNFQRFPLRIFYLDIEVEVEKNFEDARAANALCDINVITIFDNYTNTFQVFVKSQLDTIDNNELKNEIKDSIKKSIKEKKIKLYKNSKIKIKVCKDEGVLLGAFFKYWMEEKPDIITGWNVDGYDIPYIISRAMIYWDIHEIAQFLSPVPHGEIKSHRCMVNNRWCDSFRIEGVTILDYLELYSGKFGLDSKPSYTLENSAQEELGYGKLKNPYKTMEEFWKKDFPLWCVYNIQDVSLLVDLEEKLQYIAITRMVCNYGLVEYECIFSSIPYILGTFVQEARRFNKVLMTNPGYEIERQAYEGAFVFPTRKGKYMEGIGYFDFTSLYPNIMIDLNVSPEMKIGKIIKESEDKYTIKFAKHLRKGIKTLPKYKIEELIKNNDIVISGNNTIFKNPAKEFGIIPSLIKRFFDYRQEHKKAYKKIDLKIKKEKDKIKKKELELEYNKHRNTEKILKLFINSAYGVLSTNFSPLCDYDLAETITLTGQKITKFAIKHINELFKNSFGATEDSVIGADTDSTMFDLKSLSRKLVKYKNGKPDWNDIKNIKIMCDKLDELLELINKDIFKFINKTFNAPWPIINYKREYFCDRGVFTTKKRYMIHIRNEGGSDEIISKFKYTGLEIRKNELTPKIKKMLKEVVETALLQDWKNQEYQEEMFKIWEEFIKLPEDDIAFIKNYTSKKEITSFTDVEKGAGAHAKAAGFFNLIINKLNLQNKYQEIGVGDRIKFIYIIPNNKYNISVIGWPEAEDYPEEFKELFEMDYKKMFEKTVLAPLKPFEEIYQWYKFNPNKQIESEDLLNL